MKHTFEIRTNCIMCDSSLETTYFTNDFECYSGHYAVENKSYIEPLPFNILTCHRCNTAQTKYLGDLNEIYKINHADSTGTIMLGLHELMSEIIYNNRIDVKNILEIGSSVGVLADKILKKVQLEYTIIEPCYNGGKENKKIINDFYENVDDTQILANTLIISHVFEHFYKPIEILKKIKRNKNIKNFLLVFPDLEYYINNNVLHVLNTEHTYYIDNYFLINLMKLYGFNLKNRWDYKSHSVILWFDRDVYLPTIENINFTNTNYSLDTFYNGIFDNIKIINNIILSNQYKSVYIFPASIHSLYLFIFGMNTNITGLLDNSETKIGKYLCGVNIPIESFNNCIKSDTDDKVIILNGGVFNSELQNVVNTCKKIKFITIK